MRRAACLLLACTAACSDEIAVGDFQVTYTETGMRVTAGGRTLLESFTGAGAPYLPLAARTTAAKFEELYGQFRITDGDEAPWSGALEADGTVDAGAEWLGADGEPMATVEANSPAAGVLLLTFRAVDPATNRLSLAFACGPEDRFLGFGAQADTLDHRGHKISIWTSEPGIGKSASDDPPELWMIEGARHASSMGLPTWLSQRGYIAVVKNDHRSIFELCSANKDAFRIEVWDKELELWLYDGPEPARALERATAGVLGRQPRPPPLAFAPWNDALFGSDNVRRIARLIRERGIPSSAIWTEDFRGGENVGANEYQLKESWPLDRALYPDAESVADTLREQGFAWMAYFNTFIVEGSSTWDEALDGGHFVGAPGGGKYLFSGPSFQSTGLADLSRPATRAWVKSHLARALDVGFDGWMADFGEWLPADAVLHSGEEPLAAHNRYAAEWVRLNAELLAERAGDGRQRVFFARAGWLGSAHDTHVYWPGDQRTSFDRDDGMYTVLPMSLGLGLAGISTIGSDIGGYQSVGNPPATRELFFRWTTLGALSPVMRTHHGRAARANWWFGSDDASIDHFKRWASFHIRLFPYLDAGAAVFEATGMPLTRALPLVFPEDPAGWAIADQYLLGPTILVAPVVDASLASRPVHFPPGRWIPLEGGAPVDGPGDRDVPAPLTEIPVFARAGTVLPLLPDGVQSLLPAKPPTVDLADVSGQRELWLYRGAGGTFTERDGTTYRLEPTTSAVGGYAESGQALPPCVSPAQRGCVASGTRVRLAGQGPLDFAGHRLTIAGPPRRIDVEIR